MKNKKKNLNLHLLALLIFSTYYLSSLLLFNSIPLNPRDNLEINQVYNHVISKIINGELQSHRVFLAGEFKWFYLDRIFYPLNVVHIILSDKQFFFFEEISNKIISYFSFYLFSKNFFFNKKTYCILGAIFYTTLIMNISYPAPTIFQPLMPYLMYLAISKDQLKLKHMLVVFFIGLNSSLVIDYMAFPLMLIVGHFMRVQKNYKMLFIVFILMSLGMIISGTPLILSILEEPTHRIVMMEKVTLLKTVILEFKNFYEFFIPNNIYKIFYFPTNLLKLIILIYSFYLIKEKKINLFLLFIFLTYLLKILLLSNLSQIYFNDFFSLLRGFNFYRVSNILPLFFAILLVAILNINKNTMLRNTFTTLIIISSISVQIYFPARTYVSEFFKKNLKKESAEIVKINYKNKNIKKNISLITNKESYKYDNFIYKLNANNSFDNYYKFKVYKKIKNIVGAKRVASVGMDPMIAAMNDINVIDGYHNLYHLSYKKKFRKIIQEELNQNNALKKYYDDWGNRVYMFYSDENNLLFNFKEAKNLGAEYIISPFVIKNKNLELNRLLRDINKKIYLYKII